MGDSRFAVLATEACSTGVVWVLAERWAVRAHPSGRDAQLLERGRDLFNRLHARRFHVAASNPGHCVVVNPRQFRDSEPSAVALPSGERFQYVIEFHGPDYAHPPYAGQALPLRVFPHDVAMKEPNEDSHLLIAQQNLRRLVRSEKLSVNAWSIRYGLVQSTINRIVTGKLDPSTATLQEISEALARKGVLLEAWQFLAPGFGRGLHFLRVNASGGAEAIPVPAPVTEPEKREDSTAVRNLPAREDTGMRPQSPTTWTRTNHPARRASDKRRRGE